MIKPRFSFNPIVGPNPELEALHEQAKVNIEAVAEAINKAKSEWLDRTLKLIMPDAIYEMGKSGKGNDRMKVARWLSANKVKVNERPDRTEVERDGAVVSAIACKILGGSKQGVEVTITGLTGQPKPPKD